MKVAVETYGCTMNQGEGLELERKLFRLGFQVVDDCEEADVAVINTCVVIKATELKIMRRLQSLHEMQKELVVTGCMASVMREQVLSRFPRALVIAPLDYDDFENEFKARFGTGRGLFFPVPGEGSITSIVPISQGCLGSCSYCITKLARGTLDSHPPERVQGQVRKALGQGSREVLLTAQDTGCYGFDIGTDLPRLLEELVQEPGDFRLRVGMMNPDSLRDILLPLANAYRDPHVYKFLHLPVQTGSDTLLKAMGRCYAVEEFEAQVAAFRSVVPEVTLSTDLIVGFPGESEEDHRSSMELVRRIRPNIVNVTRFSARPGTEAASLPRQVVSRIAKERSRELAKLRFQVALELNSARVGEEVSALATEKGKGGTVICRDDRYAPLVVHAPLDMGQRVDLRITGAAATHLFARVA